MRREWLETLWAHFNQEGNRIPRPVEFIEARAVLYFGDNRRRDVSNYAAVLWKFVDDALVTIGVIPDDTADYIRHYEPEIVVVTSGNRLVTEWEVEDMPVGDEEALTSKNRIRGVELSLGLVMPPRNFSSLFSPDGAAP